MGFSVAAPLPLLGFRYGRHHTVRYGDDIFTEHSQSSVEGFFRQDLVPRHHKRCMEGMEILYAALSRSPSFRLDELGSKVGDTVPPLPDLQPHAFVGDFHVADERNNPTEHVQLGRCRR